MNSLLNSILFGLFSLVFIYGCAEQPAKEKKIDQKEVVEKTPEPEIKINYACDNSEINVHIQGEFAKIKVKQENIPPFEFTGKQVTSASGSKFEGIHYSFWSNGNECQIIDEGKVILQGCRETQSIKGMFMYLADANIFYPCDGSSPLKISMNGAYLELEKEYLSMVDGGTKIFIDAQGYIKKSNSEEGKKSVSKFFINKLNLINKEKTCLN